MGITLAGKFAANFGQAMGLISTFLLNSPWLSIFRSLAMQPIRLPAPGFSVRDGLSDVFEVFSPCTFFLSLMPSLEADPYLWIVTMLWELTLMPQGPTGTIPSRA